MSVQLKVLEAKKRDGLKDGEYGMIPAALLWPSSIWMLYIEESVHGDPADGHDGYDPCTLSLFLLSSVYIYRCPKKLICFSLTNPHTKVTLILPVFDTTELSSLELVGTADCLGTQDNAECSSSQYII